jgi:hypothetical protein
VNSSDAHATVERLGIADHVRRLVDAAPAIPEGAQPLLRRLFATTTVRHIRRGDAA